MITLEKANQYRISHPSDEIVRVGQGTSGSFKPNLSIGCFKGLGSLTFLPQLSGNFSPQIQGESLVIDHNTFKLTMFSTSGKLSFNEYGGIDFIITLKKKPLSNKISFGYDLIMLVPYLQPALTAREIVAGNERPDHVVNSIAWYHGTKGGLVAPSDVSSRITTGKAFHQYRLKVIALDGSWIWADWELSAGNLVTLVIDQTFLNTKPYPMLAAPVGDTFGYTSVGASSAIWSTGFVRTHGDTYTGAAGTGDSMSIYGNRGATNGNIQMALYDNATPSNLIANSATASVLLNSVTPQWWTAASSSPTLSAVPYYVCFQSQNTSNYPTVYYDATGGDLKYVSQTWGTWPATITWTVATGVPRQFSLYCTYTPSGGGWVNIAKVNDVAEASIASVGGVAKASIAKINGIAV